MDICVVSPVEQLLRLENYSLRRRIDALENLSVGKDHILESLNNGAQRREEIFAGLGMFSQKVGARVSECKLGLTIRETMAVDGRSAPPKVLQRPLPRPCTVAGLQGGLADLVKAPPSASRLVAFALVYSRHRSKEPETGVEVECSHCGRKGHEMKLCFFNPSSPNFRPNLLEGKCRVCLRKGHSETDCYFNPDSSNYRPGNAKTKKRRNKRRGGE